VPTALVVLVEPVGLVAVVPIELDIGVVDDIPLGAPVTVVPIGSVANSPGTPVELTAFVVGAPVRVVTLPTTVVRAAGELVVPVVMAPVVIVAVVPVDVVAKEPGTLVVAVVLVVVVPVDPVTPVEPVVLVGIPNALVSP
jgi:hypothetical protein